MKVEMIIYLKKDDTLDEESYRIDIAENIEISAADRIWGLCMHF